MNSKVVTRKQSRVSEEKREFNNRGTTKANGKIKDQSKGTNHKDKKKGEK